MRKSINNKQVIMQAFNFEYAGIAQVFITMSGHNYVVCSSGFEIIDDIPFFKKDKCYVREKYNELLKAIHRFNYVVKTLCSTVDWFTPDFYEPFNYKNLNKNYVH